MQVDPIKPTFKAPETQRSKLKCDQLLSSFAFGFKLHRYSKAPLWERGFNKQRIGRDRL